MRNKKLILFSILFIWLLLLSAVVDAETQGDWTYTVNNKKVTITAYTGNDADVTIPGRIAGYPVTAIGASAFKNCSSLFSVNIPDSIISIGNSAFYGCLHLSSVLIPDSITSIGNSAFYSCTNLASITIPNSVTSIGAYAFENCYGLVSISIPDSVASIGILAFCGCPAKIFCTISSNTSKALSEAGSSFVDSQFPDLYLRYSYSDDDIVGLAIVNADESIVTTTIPYSVTSIGKSAFRDCTSLSSITIPDSVTSIGKSAFSGCSSLSSVTIPDSVSTIGDYAFSDCSSLSSVTIPDSVTSIGKSAFSGCSSLSSVTISDSVTSISASAFSYCSTLSSITIPNSVISIDSSAFSCCFTLSSVIIPDSVTSIGDNAFENCSGLVTISIPDSVTSIGKSTFSYCRNLASITIPDAITSIGSDAFYNCPAIRYCLIDTAGSKALSKAGFSFVDPQYPTLYLKYSYSGDDITGFAVVDADEGITEIVFPDEITSIGNSAFSNCSGLASVIIPDSVSSISYEAFSNCSSLASVTIPDSVTYIGNYAFSKCFSLASVTIPDSVTYIDYSAFDNCPAIRYCSIDTAGSKALSKVNYSFVDPQYPCLYLRYSYSIDDITGFAVVDADESISEAVIPDGITSIGDSAFSNCSGLASITIPDSVFSIGYESFSDCSSLNSVTIPDGVTSIDCEAFYHCPAIRYCSVNTDGSKALSKAYYSFVDPQYPGLYLRYSYSGDDITGFAVVDADNSITEVIFPDGITSIDSSAFSGCSSLYSISIPDSVTSIGSSAFSRCSSLYSISIPDSVTSIGSSAFSRCSSLTSVTIPNSVTTIGDYAFPTISKILLPQSLTSLGSDPFPQSSSIYCYEFSEADFWAQEHGYSNIIYIDNLEADEYRSITLLTQSTDRYPGICETITAQVFPDFDQPKVSWRSSDPSIATVNNGIVTFINPGVVSISAISGSALANVELIVNSLDQLRRISLPEQEISVARGESIDITATVYPDIDTPSIIWGSSDPSIVTVDNGKITGTGKGTAIVTASVGSATASVNAHCYAELESFELIPEEWVLTKTDSQLSLIDITPADADFSVNWFSSDQAVATIDKNGLITARRPGLASITATANGITRECLLHVVYPVTQITFDNPEITIYAGEDAQLIAHVTTREESFDNRLITFSSSDETVALIEETGLIHALKAGKATIIARADSGISASIEFFVLPCLTHSPVPIPGILPADGHPGLSIGSMCSVCGLVLETPQEIKSVTTLSLPAALKTINAKAFEKTAADHVLLPAGTTAIGSRAFADAPNLRFVTMPDSVTDIASDAFEGCELVTFFCNDASDAAAYAESHGFAHTAP